MIRKLAIGLTGLAVAGKAYETYQESHIFTRTFRTIRCGLHILYAYKIAFNEENYLDIHESVAEDIYNTCILNDGLYVKFGQGIATMDHLLPPPFYKHMSKLQDKAKSVEYHKIAKLFEEEVGRKIQDCFDEFAEQPVASASLAQVHKAKLKSGEEVAVKIQKPSIRPQFGGDMAMHWLINYVLEKAFDLPLLHFVEDIQINLEKQLDFRIESDNSKRAQKNFKLLNRSELYVPKVVDQFTRKRVMVSEWIDGIKITDDEKLKELNYNKKDIMNKLIRAFSDQIFVTGFVHCDPHPGNVFLRPHPENPKQFQIVILDHGLCLELSNDFRKNYSNFWKAMFLHDNKKMQEICEKWGIKFAEQFAGSQMMRPYNAKKMINEKVEKKDVIKLQGEMKQKLRQMMKQSQKFPRELIFVGRNMNLVRSLNKYHGGIAERITIMAKSAYIGSETEDFRKPRTGLAYNWSAFSFNANILLLQIINWFLKKVSGQYIEEYIEDSQAKETEQIFLKYGFKAMDENSFNA